MVEIKIDAFILCMLMVYLYLQEQTRRKARTQSHGSILIDRQTMVKIELRDFLGVLFLPGLGGYARLISAHAFYRQHSVVYLSSGIDRTIVLVL